jgi:hypothetical protein
MLNAAPRTAAPISAFWLPRGAPDPGAPPCIRKRLLPGTAGDMQGLPERVFAPQRGLDSIGPVLRGWSPVIWLTCVLAEPEKTRVHLRSASEIAAHSVVPRGLACSPRHVAHDCLAAFADADMLDCDLLFAPGAVAFKRFHLGRKCPGQFVEGPLGAVLLRYVLDLG